MRSFKLDNTGDLIINNRKSIELIEGAEEVAQRNEITLAINQGEWFLNKNLGLPITDKILRKGTTEEEIQREIVSALLDDPAIESVDNIDFNIDYKNRSGQITIEGTLIEGEDFRMEVEV